MFDKPTNFTSFYIHYVLLVEKIYSTIIFMFGATIKYIFWNK